MASTSSQAYTAAVALEGWNYIRYIGPLTNPQTDPLFLCVKQGDLVVEPNREPSKLWYVSRLRAPEDDVNRHACSFKHEGTQTYLSYNLSASQRDGEAVLGPQVQFDLLRVDSMHKPCHIKVHQDACAPEEDCPEENCEEGAGDAGPTVDEPIETDSEEHEKETNQTIEEPPEPLEWYLGVSEDLKVVIKSFPVSSEGTAGPANEWPVWELTTRDEAIDEDHPPTPVPPARDPRAANNPMRREYYMRPDRFESYERNFWPKKSRPE